ncbi:MAG: hypothetical protein ACRDKT_03655 [Actinomycetota bacterium]
MTRIADVRPYESCNVVGVVLRLSLAPLEGRVSASVGDGTGVITATWHLVRPTPQLLLGPGTWVALTGVARVDLDGDLSLWEPNFTVVPSVAGAPA